MLLWRGFYCCDSRVGFSRLSLVRLGMSITSSLWRDDEAARARALYVPPPQRSLCLRHGSRNLHQPFLLDGRKASETIKDERRVPACSKYLPVSSTCNGCGASMPRRQDAFMTNPIPSLPESGSQLDCYGKAAKIETVRKKKKKKKYNIRVNAQNRCDVTPNLAPSGHRIIGCERRSGPCSRDTEER